MPTIRVSQNHYDKVEQLAVKATTERNKLVTIGKALEEHLDQTLKEYEECGESKIKKKDDIPS